MSAARRYHTATLLPNGQVLAVGGYDNTNVLASAELFNPATGPWTATASLNRGRWVHTASLLPDGEVVIAAGNAAIPGLPARNYIVTRAESSHRSIHLSAFPHILSSTCSPAGKVLYSGGQNGGVTVRTSEIYDPASNTMTLAGLMSTDRVYQTSLLPNGKVLTARRSEHPHLKHEHSHYPLESRTSSTLPRSPGNQTAPYVNRSFQPYIHPECRTARCSWPGARITTST